MSVNIKTLSGLVKVAGNTILLDGTCSEIQSGTITIPANTTEGNWSTTVTMPTAMTDTDYIVILNVLPVDGSLYTSNANYRYKTTTSFIVHCVTGNVPLPQTIEWYAFRLVELEGYNAIYNKLTNIDSTPTENSTNLVTSGGVYDAISSASKIFVNSESAWNELDAETKATYQVAIFTNQPTVNAVDSTDGSTTVVGEPNKRWTGSQNEWSNLTAAEKAKYEIVCFTDSGDVPTPTQFATISSENAAVTVGEYICSKNGKNVCVMLKGHTNDVVSAATKLYSGFFSPLVTNSYAYLDIPFAIRNRTTNVTEMRMGYLDANGNFYTSAYTEDIENDWDIQLFFSYQTE